MYPLVLRIQQRESRRSSRLATWLGIGNTCRRGQENRQSLPMGQPGEGRYLPTTRYEGGRVIAMQVWI